ncbi:toll/interleukin-1 receptor domain-containing protein [Marinibaculum pumilum]|uniref:Toll/interleukin-1 receptor domain-containing protein n=1 Tax=Marinibaculum pumilum TaxID=1766165 RepID=A0ABV7L3I2_9PROT
MAIALSALRNAARRPTPQVVATLREARAQGINTVFLCHSHNDEVLVRGVVTLLRDAGWDVYVDWLDTTMPQSPNLETARRIQEKIREDRYFLFLATPNSTSSRWCPWEIGYADGVKPHSTIFIITTRDDGGNHYGNEYLQIYNDIDFIDSGELAVFGPASNKGTPLALLDQRRVERR